MEQKLKSILDYQRFSPNRRLSAIIEDVEKRYYALDDDVERFFSRTKSSLFVKPLMSGWMKCLKKLKRMKRISGS